MSANSKPTSWLTKDKKTYFFPLICCTCSTWFPSVGDMKFHFGNCKTLHRNLQCGHCACIFTDWHSFIMHVNVKGMSLAQPYSDAFSWKNIAHWQNPQTNQNSDILSVAMQHADVTTLPSHKFEPSDSILLLTQDSETPILLQPSSSMPTTTEVHNTTDTQSSVGHASIFTQTTPAHNLFSNSDLEISIPISLWQSYAANLQSLQEHVNALLQLNLLLAQLLLYRMQPDRFLTAHEQFVLQHSVAQSIWPQTFLQCSTVSELLNAILVWLYEQF